MRNAYDQYNNVPSDQRNIIYLPMFCRLSLKDVRANNYQNHNSVKDPSSPKVSCIGQVKTRSNRVLSPTTTVNHHHRQLRHTAKPRKSSACSFPNKTLLQNTTTTLLTTKPRTSRSYRVGNRDSRNSMMMMMRRDDDRIHTHPCYYKKNTDCCDNDCVDIINMDPPLPVAKKVDVVSEVSLWKRRFNGDRRHELKGLKIEQLCLRNFTGLNDKPLTTV